MKCYKPIALITVTALLFCLIFSGCFGDSSSSSSSMSSSSSSSSSSSAFSSSSMPDVTSSSSLSSSSSMRSESSSASDLSSQAVINPNFSELYNLDAAKKGWGPGTDKNDKGQPFGALDYQNKYGKYDADFIRLEDESAGKIYLTFDEGYENGYTASILDTLKEKNTPAVFFITYSYATANPELVQRMIDEGHIVGNHSYKHPCFPDISLERAQEEVMFLHNYIKETFNYEMTLFRFPEGAFSEQMLGLLQQLNYRCVFWSFAYKDWDVNAQIGASAAYEKVTANAHDGAVFLLHAVSKDNAEILGSVIDNFREKGYELAAYPQT